MSHIYIYSPSSAQRDKAAFRRGVRRLEALGHAVEVDADALATHMRFAGDDATRLAAIHRAAASGADLAMISRGGYGLTRLLADIRYKTLAKAIEQGTRFMGFSDFTALQCALFAKTGARTWIGPAIHDDIGFPDEPDDIAMACLDDLLQGQGEGAGWQLPRLRARVSGADPAPGPSRAIRKAVLWGGNLAVLTSLVGTPYFPQVRGGVLVLEDVAEHPYRVERMLTQLLHAGVLAQQKAIVLGQFVKPCWSGAMSEPAVRGRRLGPAGAASVVLPQRLCRLWSTRRVALGQCRKRQALFVRLGCSLFAYCILLPA
jgi:muramoyltetrapeptide carboxypeptidase